MAEETVAHSKSVFPLYLQTPLVMKLPTLLPFMCACLLLAGCAHRTSSPAAELATDSIRTDTTPTRPAPKPLLKGTDIVIEKDLLYDKYTLKDTYPQKDTAWSFKWTLIEEWLAEVENMQRDSTCRWVVMQNYKNRNREAPVVRNYHRNDYGRVSDSLNIERYQSAPLYLLTDTAVPERYGRDGTLAYGEGEEGSFMRIRLTGSGEKWLVPKRYLKELPDSTRFRHVIIVDRGSQHIATLERQAKGHWLVRSMNPCTTGRRRPPYAQPTPLGMFLLQEKKRRMVYLKDGSAEHGGFAPYACRFTNGAYLHGVPVNAPHTQEIEYSYSLGTTPRSHMCVRVATSHGKFIYEWAPVLQSLIIVIE